MAGGNLTLAQLKTAVRQRSDMQTSDFISDDELTSYINQSYFELYDLLVQKYGNEYFVADPFEFDTTGTDDYYDLPDDFYKLLGVDLQLGNTEDSWVTIPPFMFAERNKYSVPNFQTFYGLTNMRYRLKGDQMWLTPRAAAGQTMRFWYVPRLAELEDDADVAVGVSGWLEYIICDAAIKCLQKEESDVSVLFAEKQGLINRIEAAAENRDQGNPQTVSDTLSASMWWPNGTGDGGY